MADKTRSDYYTLATLGHLSASLNKNKQLVSREDIEIRKEVFRLQREAHALLSRHRKLQRDRVAERRRIALLRDHLSKIYEMRKTEYNTLPAAERRQPGDGCDGSRAVFLKKWIERACHVLRYADELMIVLDKQIQDCDLDQTRGDDDRDSSSGTSDSDDSDGDGDDEEPYYATMGKKFVGYLAGSGAALTASSETTSTTDAAATDAACPCACNPCHCIEKKGVCHCPKPPSASTTKVAFASAVASASAISSSSSFSSSRKGRRTTARTTSHAQSVSFEEAHRFVRGGARIPRDGYEYPRKDEIGGGVLTGNRQRRRSRVGKLDCNGVLERLAAQLRYSRTKLKTLCEDDYLVCICGTYYDLRDVDPCKLAGFIGNAPQ